MVRSDGREPFRRCAITPHLTDASRRSVFPHKGGRPLVLRDEFVFHLARNFGVLQRRRGRFRRDAAKALQIDQIPRGEFARALRFRSYLGPIRADYGAAIRGLSYDRSLGGHAPPSMLRMTP